MTTIMVFGDSICWGAWDPCNGGWVSRLKCKVETELLDFKIFNLGIPSETTSHIIKRFEKEFNVRKSDDNIVIFAVGMNDTCYYKEIPETTIKKFKINIKKLYDLAKKHTDKIIFVGLTRVDETKTKPTIWDKNEFFENQVIEVYDTIIKQFCISENLLFIDVSEVNFVTDDGLHPNSKGHELIFQKVYNELKSFKTK